MIIIQNWLTDKFLKRIGKVGFIPCPFLIFLGSWVDLTNSSGKGVLAHEHCHQRQMLKMGYIGFIVKYIWDWAMNGFRYSRDLPLEREAYKVQKLIEEEGGESNEKAK